MRLHNYRETSNDVNEAHVSQPAVSRPAMNLRCSGCYDGVRCGYIFFVVDGRGNILYRRIVMMPREGWGFLYQVKQAVWVELCCVARVWIGPTGGRGGVERVTARGNAMYWDIQSLTIRAMGQI